MFYVEIILDKDICSWYLCLRLQFLVGDEMSSIQHYETKCESLIKPEYVYQYDSFSEDERINLVKNYLNSLDFDKGKYSGTYGIHLLSRLAFSFKEYSFVEKYQDVFRSLGYSVVIKEYRNAASVGVDFIITEKRKYTEKDCWFEVKIASGLLGLFVLGCVVFLGFGVS